MPEFTFFSKLQRLLCVQESKREGAVGAEDSREEEIGVYAYGRGESRGSEEAGEVGEGDLGRGIDPGGFSGCKDRIRRCEPCAADPIRFGKEVGGRIGISVHS